MIAEAIAKIQELTRTGLEVGPKSARKVVMPSGELVDLECPKATAETVKLTTLVALSEYVRTDFDSVKEAGIFVFGPSLVQLNSKIFGDFRQRETFVLVEPHTSKGFQYSQYIDIESFVTSMQSFFVQDHSVAAVLSVVGNIQTELVQSSMDDGVSQTVTARSGIAKAVTASVPNPVSLRPFRTFPEIEQPASNFVLRLQRRDGKLPLVALFETGDNQWQVEAIKKIGTYLRDQNLGIPVFA
jgi:hypothetical protein